MGFNFACVADPKKCNYRAVVLSMNLLRHFYKCHAELLPVENKLAQMMFQEVPKGQRGRNEQTKKKAVKNAFGRPADFEAAYAKEQDAERKRSYTKELIKLLKQNEGVTYKCLAAMRSHWKVVVG